MSVLDITPPEFVSRAACAGANPELFFPLSTGDQATEAKAICGGCPVAPQCLAWAMDIEAAHPGSRYGVYGGMSPKQRDKLARRSA